jgi:hypothetical protein
MSPRAHHRSWWPLTLAAALALAQGCSRDPEPQDDLVFFRNSHGTLSCRYVPKKPPAPRAPAVASSTPLDVWLKQDLAEAQNRRRMNALAERDARREREDRWRLQQQEQNVYQAARQQTIRDQRLQERERELAYRQQQSEWIANQRLRGAVEAARWQQASQPFDTLLVQNQLP